MTTTTPDGGSAKPAAGQTRLPLKGLLLLASITVFWGVNWPAMKLAVSVIPVWDFRLLCLLVGGVGVLAISRLGGNSIRLPLHEARPLLICALFNVVGWHVFTGYGVYLMESGRAAIVAFTMPIWASLLSVWVLHERLTLPRIIGLALGLAGLGALIGPEIAALQRAPLGALVTLAGAISWATGTVLLKRVRWSVPTATLAGWQLIAGSPVIGLGALLLAADQPWAESWTWAQRIGLLYALTIPMVYCFWAWLQTVRLFPAPIAAIGTLGIPVIGVFSGAVILGETIGVIEIVALGLVVGALVSVLILPSLRARID